MTGSEWADVLQDLQALGEKARGINRLLAERERVSFTDLALAAQHLDSAAAQAKRLAEGARLKETAP